jgi:hypothetical protein
MKNIEKYLKGDLNHSARINFEKKMETDKNFRNLVFINKNIDFVMKGTFLAAEAETEMIRKKIDRVAAGMVMEFYDEKESKKNHKEFLSWS